jgi:YD repeat-containing protein
MGSGFRPGFEMLRAICKANSETHTYNSMFQLTQLQVGSSALNIQYAYSGTQNNGKITSQSDVISGEQIAYTYDALNRLFSAQTTQTGGTQWGQSYTYDGFGNLTDQTVIKGSAPDVHVAYWRGKRHLQPLPGARQSVSDLEAQVAYDSRSRSSHSPNEGSPGSLAAVVKVR